MAHKKYKIILGFLILAFIISIVLSVFPTPDICSVESGCNVVQNSSYNYLLGIKNSFFGIVIFAVMALLVFLQMKYHLGYRRKLINYGIVIGSVVSVYFLYLQAFVLHAYCKYCVVIDIMMVLSLAIVLYWWEE